MAIHSRYWDRPVKNDSCDFNYQEWTQTGRKNAAKYIKSDTRKQTEAQEELELNPQIRVVVEPGGGCGSFLGRSCTRRFPIPLDRHG